jgi:hypothetical protein
MSNTILTNSIIAKEALMLLENNLVLGNLVHRAYEDEFNKEVNGYTPGATISIRKPAKYTLRTGATMAVQDSVEGTTSLSVNTQLGVDVGGWTSADRTLSIPEFNKRFLESAMITIAQGVDAQIAALYKDVYNWVGTPGTVVNSFADFALAPQRLDEMAVPVDNRSAVLNPADHWGLVGSFTGLYINSTAKTALEKAKLPDIGGVAPYMSQNAPQHTTGSRTDSTPIVNGNVTTTYAATKDTGVQDLPYTGAISAGTFKQGDVINIADVYAVNPVSKQAQSYLQDFVVKGDITSSGGAGTLSISPPIITSGAYQTVSTAGSIASKAITNKGSASTIYKQSMVFHKNAFALAVVPMIKPEGAVDVQRVSHNGLSIRMIPVYTGASDTSAIRLDILLGTKTIYADLATRLSGT